MKIVFCIPGCQFSGAFLTHWTHLVKELEKNDIQWELINVYSPIVHISRRKIVDWLISGNEKYKDYDYAMWIDDDMVFQYWDLEDLLAHDVDIVSGLYFSYNVDHKVKEREYACVGLNRKRFTKSGLDNYSRDKNYPKLIEVSSNGMGWMLVKKGDFESLMDNKYKNPFISKTMLENPRGEVAICEDIAFQQNAKEKGFKSYVDPSVIVGHEKLIPLEEFKVLL